MRTVVPLIIVFIDLARFAAQSQRVEDTELAEGIDRYYQHVAAGVQEAGGRVIKFIGDAVLAVFPPTAADQAVEAILRLKTTVDRMMAERGWECRMTGNMHFGEVVAGDFGPAGEERYDIIGKAVNAAAALGTRGLTLSGALHVRLHPDLRRRFLEQGENFVMLQEGD